MAKCDISVPKRTYSGNQGLSPSLIERGGGGTKEEFLGHKK